MVFVDQAIMSIEAVASVVRLRTVTHRDRRHSATRKAAAWFPNLFVGMDPPIVRLSPLCSTILKPASFAPSLARQRPVRVICSYLRHDSRPKGVEITMAPFEPNFRLSVGLLVTCQFPHPSIILPLHPRTAMQGRGRFIPGRPFIARSVPVADLPELMDIVRQERIRISLWCRGCCL